MYKKSRRRNDKYKVWISCLLYLGLLVYLPMWFNHLNTLFHLCLSNGLQLITKDLILGSVLVGMNHESIHDSWNAYKNMPIRKHVRLICIGIGMGICSVYYALNVCNISLNPMNMNVLLFISIVCTTPFVEELFFRKVLFEYFELKHRSMYAFVITNTLFALLHGGFTKMFVLYFVCSSLLTVVYLNNERSIVHSSVVHSVYNICIILLSLKGL